MEKLNTNLILIGVIGSLFISSCGLFKNRTVNTQVDIEKQETTSKTRTDSSRKVDVIQQNAIYEQDEYDNEIVIQTDTGIVTITGTGVFTGKAKSVSIKSKGASKKTDTSRTTTSVSENKTQLYEVSTKTYVKKKVKQVESKFPWVWALVSCAVAVGVWLTVRKLAKYHR